MARWLVGWLAATTALAILGAALAVWALFARAPEPVAAAAQVQQQQVDTRVGVLDRNEALMLVRGAIAALNSANRTGNYAVLRDLGAPGFRAGNTPERLAEIFADLRNNRYDLSPALVIEPRFLIPPRLEGNGQLRMAGFFPSLPLQVNFDLLFEPGEGRWRIFGIALTVGPPGPATPQAPANQPPAPAAAPPANQPASPPAQPAAPAAR